MITQIKLFKWKSFKESILYIDPLTILIGTNASGKSNIIDAIAFLNNAFQGKDLQVALNGERAILLEGMIGAVRGGAEWAAMYPGDQFSIEVTVEEEDDVFEYTITVKNSSTGGGYRGKVS